MKGCGSQLAGIICVLHRALAIPPSTVMHAAFRAVMLDNPRNDILSRIFSVRTGFSCVLYYSASTGSGFCDDGSQVCLITGGCRQLQCTGAGRYLRDAVSAHSRNEAAPNNTDALVSG